MKVLVQWSKDPAEGWVEVDSADWGGTPSRGEPPSDRRPVYNADKSRVVGIEGTPVELQSDGFVARVAIQGVVVDGDHIAVEDGDGFTQVSVWNDDPGDPETRYSNGVVRRFYPEIVETTFRLNRRESMRCKGPKQELDIYVPADVMPTVRPLYLTGGQARVLDYSTFVPPSPHLTRHGLWLTNDQLDALQAHHSPHWKTWME